MFAKITTLMMGIILSINLQASDECGLKNLTGSFTNPLYDGKENYQSTSVELKEVSPDNFQVIFNIPCGTKLTPKVFEVLPGYCLAGKLKLIDEGSSQCYTGENPDFFIIGDKLSIYTESRIRVPGFNGVYSLKRISK